MTARDLACTLLELAITEVQKNGSEDDKAWLKGEGYEFFVLVKEHVEKSDWDRWVDNGCIQNDSIFQTI